jgi:Na+:H+ antiporter, NhaA family
MSDRDPSLLTPPPESWQPVKLVAERLLSPIQRFLHIEAASGILLLLATAVALAWANSPWSESYQHLWHTPFGLRLGDWAFERDLHFWVNDGLMTLFFFVVGLEIRREIYEGELSQLRRAALPLAAALGGMLVPAAVYIAFNHGKAGADGWGIPMATDIAFAVGVLVLLGKRCPPALRVLLLALAVIDDIGAILVIALFYSSGLDWSGFAIAGGGLVAILLLRAAGVRTVLLYVVPGVAAWYGTYRGGIHPTLAGVVIGLMTPVKAWFGAGKLATEVQRRLVAAGETGGSLVAQVAPLARATREVVSPAEYLQHQLHGLVAFGVMPIFALANAGVVLGGADLTGDALMILAGIIGGLVLGKPIGIVVTSWLATRTNLATQPKAVTGVGLTVVGMVGGIGFTMSLFIAQLAFARPDQAELLATAKLAILIASAVAILAGGVLGMLGLRPPTVGERYADEAEAERSTTE